MKTINNIKTYDKYKDSGIEWIGKIPQEWKITQVKNYCETVYSGGTPDTTKPEYWEGNISWLPSGEVQNCIICNPVRYITNEGLENSSTKMIPANTTLIAMTGATCGNVGYLTFDSCANQSVTAYIAKNTTYSKFLYYLLQSAKEEILLNKTGGAQGGINVFNCKSILVPYLSYVEQQQIVDYLDKKCGEVDRVVEVQKLIIEKLKEYKQSVITEAVTKGLDKNAPLKDSGIEWIGKIPEHWETRRLKTTLILRNEKSEYNGETYIGLENIKSYSGRYTLSDEVVIDGISNKFLPQDILFGKLRPYLAKATIVDFAGICSSEFLVFSNFQGLNKYLLAVLLSHWFIDIVNSSTYGSKMPRASWEFIGNMKIPFPNKDEQQQIADYLDNKCAEIDKAISEKEALIEKLTEYKKSLIYECVTGKRRVSERHCEECK